MRSKFIHTLAAMSLVVFLGTAHADDTDIYANTELPPGSEPLA